MVKVVSFGFWVFHRASRGAGAREPETGAFPVWPCSVSPSNLLPVRVFALFERSYRCSHQMDETYGDLENKDTAKPAPYVRLNLDATETPQ